MSMIERRTLALEHVNDIRKGLFHPKNVSKGGWSDVSVSDLLRLMEDEVEEFKAAIWQHIHGGGSVDRVAAEGADISNFVAMITYNLRRKNQ